ncbi:hypothetical protein U1Q18_051313 [Sarracenia purpurea var. burkii]
MAAKRKASLLTSKALPTNKAKALKAKTLSIPIFMIPAAMMGATQSYHEQHAYTEVFRYDDD